MTMTTRVVLHDDVDPLALSDWINAELLGKPDAERDITPGQIWNVPGQGLDAWVWIYHPAEADDEDWPGRPVGTAMVSFDTAYGHDDIGVLHARYVARLAEHFGPLTWQLEHDGSWHPLADLPLLASTSDQAWAWFKSEVAPLLRRLA
jgi:hypothetical protein